MDSKTLSTNDDDTKAGPPQQIFRHEGGIAELIETLCQGRTPLFPEHKIVAFKGISKKHRDIEVEVALQWSKDMYTDALFGFANGIRTSDGGTHLDGFKSSLNRILNHALQKAAGSSKAEVETIPGEYLREGLTAVVSVKVREAEFEGQTKTRLGTPEARGAVDAIVAEGFQQVLDFQQPQLATMVAQKAQQAMAAASAARAARDLVRRKSLLTSTVLPGKLADCSLRDASLTEIYLVEGDSAAGSAKQGRDRRFQAILPLKGKILNIERATTEKIYQNLEIQAMVAALGLGVRNAADFMPSTQLRYHKIILMTDADVDGAHIRLLLLTFLYRYQRQLLEQGHVYIACPPLYKVTLRGSNIPTDEAKIGGGKKSASSSSEVRYLYDQSAYDELAALSPSVTMHNVQRFKGLGEMMPQQLWETTMDPATRTLKQVTVESAASANRLFNTLMGDATQPRKEFIVSNADAMSREDLDY